MQISEYNKREKHNGKDKRRRQNHRPSRFDSEINFVLEIQSVAEIGNFFFFFLSPQL
jgi:hypothetical protein